MLSDIDSLFDSDKVQEGLHILLSAGALIGSCDNFKLNSVYKDKLFCYIDEMAALMNLPFSDYTL